MLAPIFLTTYCRINHLKRAIESLRKSPLASESHLYILSDGPKPGDERRVTEIRQYLDTIDGFGEVVIIKRCENNRSDNINELRNILYNHGTCIAIEEDLEFSPAFLEFINHFLITYKDDPNVFNVGGFTPVNQNSAFDYYFIRRFEGWGCGFWAEKFKCIENDLPRYEEIQSDWTTMRRIEAMGEDVKRMIAQLASGRLKATDVLICYHSALRGLLSLLPTETLVLNHGLDGSGEHCAKTDMFAELVISEKFEHSHEKRNSEVDHDLEKIVRDFYNSVTM